MLFLMHMLGKLTKATPVIHHFIWTQCSELNMPNVASDSLLPIWQWRMNLWETLHCWVTEFSVFCQSYSRQPLFHSSGAVQDTLFKFVKQTKADSAPFFLRSPHWTRSPSKTTVPRHVTSSLVTCNSCSILFCYYVLQNNICKCTNVQSVWSNPTPFRFIAYAYLFYPYYVSPEEGTSGQTVSYGVGRPTVSQSPARRLWRTETTILRLLCPPYSDLYSTRLGHWLHWVHVLDHPVVGAAVVLVKAEGS